MRKAFAVALMVAIPCQIFARLDPAVCGTHAEKANEELFLHRQAVRRRPTGGIHLLETRGPGLGAKAGRNAGEIALIDDSNGVVSRRNPFDLNQKTLGFIPTKPDAASYRFEVTGVSYDQAAAASGTLVELGDDDTRPFVLPFAFPYFGGSYRQINVNSDGNATFNAGDAAATDRSFGRLTGGLPRIAPLFTDLDPSAAQRGQGVFVTSEPGRFVVSWVNVPLYSQFGTGRPQTFQMRLYPDGRIEFTWSDVGPADAVTGISPGRLQGAGTLLSFTAGSTQEFSAAVGERFSGSDSVDIAEAAQQFYATHDDAYDYLAIFNAEGLAAAPGAVAYEVTTRNQRTGYGDQIVDIGQDFGSQRRLQAVLNMGPLSQYPVDPNAVVPARFLSRDTPLTLLGHEAGHLFLAFASVHDPNDPTGQPMLGRQLAHWSFLFNSEASLLEGNRIQDDGPDASPRFTTIGTVQGYAPLDQYLMGFRAPAEVPPTFLVTDSGGVASRSPQFGVKFDGNRRDISVEDVIGAMGRRTPDYTVAQRRFRFAFLLIVPAGSTPSAAQITQLEMYRSLFDGFYQQATSYRAAAESTLKRAVHLSAFPASGLVYGSMAAASISLDAPAATTLTLQLESETGGVALPPYAVIPAGASQTGFYMLGLRPGVDTITVRPVDAAYETAFSKIQVAESAENLQLQVLSGDHPERIALRVTDVNNLPYPNIVVRAAVTSGILESAVSYSDVDGIVRFRWTSGSGPVNQFTATINGGAAIKILDAAK